MYDARGGPLRPACKLGWDCHLHHDLALLLVEGVSSMWSRQIQTGGGPSFMGFPLNSRGAGGWRARSVFSPSSDPGDFSLSLSTVPTRHGQYFLAAFRAIASFGRRQGEALARVRRASGDAQTSQILLRTVGASFDTKLTRRPPKSKTFIRLTRIS